ncbi:MAG: redoxin domain-containing protein [Myxococcota bacterium]
MIALLFAAFAQSPFGDPVERCLRANDVPCAREALRSLGADSTTDPDLLAQKAHVAFYAGDFPAAREAIDAAVAAGWNDEWNRQPLYERTLYATAFWAEVTPMVPGGTPSRFRIRFKPGLDEVLLEGAGDALLRTEQNITPLLGATPPGVTLLEVYPDSRTFIAASSLSESDVRTTGVVALSKWSRLLVTSPRALARGYDWQDTIAHEYIHLVVAHNTDDRAPVWLQEAIAKYLDNRWRDGSDHWELSIRDQGLLAKALSDNDLVTFDEMHPSLAKLPTAERAALAYAQVSALMAFCFERKGEGVLLEALPLVKSGVDAREALARGAGFSAFSDLESAYIAWMRTLKLRNGELAELPTVFAEDGTSDQAIDPVLSRREDLHRFVRLGTLLREHERPRAALVEYEKARDPEEPNSPYLSNMIAQTFLDLGDVKSAQGELSASLEDYPEFALTHKTLGQIRLKQGDSRGARSAFEAAAELNPYDPSVQAALADLAKARGDTAELARRAGYVDILRKGGSDTEFTPLHEISGEYILPGGAESSDAEGLEAAFVGEMAPQIRVTDLEGNPVTLDDYRGQVVVLDFWATWCGPCRSAMPHLAELDARDGVVVLGLTDESLAKVKPFLAKTDVPYRIVLDKGGTVKGRYKVRSLPTVFVIDPRGRVSAVVVGAGGPATAKLDDAVSEAGAL